MRSEPRLAGLAHESGQAWTPLRDLPVTRKEHAPADVRRNALAIALNGLFFPPAGGIVSAGLVLTWFVSDLTAAAWVAGLIVPVQYGFSLIAQPFFADWIGSRPSRAPVYRGQALFRGILWCLLAAVTWALGSAHSGQLLALFFAVVLLDAFAAGLGNIAFSDTLASSPPTAEGGREGGAA